MKEFFKHGSVKGDRCERPKTGKACQASGGVLPCCPAPGSLCHPYESSRHPPGAGVGSLCPSCRCLSVLPGGIGGTAGDFFPGGDRGIAPLLVTLGPVSYTHLTLPTIYS